MARERVQLKTPEQVLAMRRAGLVVADALDAVRAAAAPGRTTADLDAVAARVIADAGATPSFLGYHGFPAATCVSVNEEVVHGIPGPKVLAAGDVVSVDCGAVVDGWHGDAAFTTVLGPRDGGGEGSQGPDAGDAHLVATTEAALWDGIAALATGERLADVGAAVQDRVEGRPGPDGVSLEVVEGYTGHGIGTAMHQAPDVLNHRVRGGLLSGLGIGGGGQRRRLRPGMCLAVEPMVVRGDATTVELDDGWTVVTTSGERAAHSEHSVALLDGGIWVLTARDGGAAELGARGVPVVTPRG